VIAGERPARWSFPQ